MGGTRSLPNALVVGAQKSGTTSLFYYLRQHPDIFLPVRKELHYFSYDLLRQNVNGPGDSEALMKLCATRQEYESHYAAAETERVIAEVSPSYLYFCQVSERIHSELGAVKIIALLRNPVKKAFSQYMHLVQRNREALSFYKALMAETQRQDAGWGDMWRYAESSLYANRIKKYISVFGESNVKIILTDDLARKPHEAMRELFEFLEVDVDYRPDTSVIHNRSGLPRSQLVADFLVRPSKLRTIAQMFIAKPIRTSIRKALVNANLNKGKLDSKSREYLIPYFRDDVAEVEEIIGRRTGWMN